MGWPAQSSDFNPILHLWEHLKRQLNRHPDSSQGVWELWERVEIEWGEIKAEVSKIDESMPRRIEAVIKLKGGHTKY